MLSRKTTELIAGCPHGCHAGASPVSGRIWQIVAGVLSLGVWMLVPKCPVCVAAHVALWTGLGLSLAAAAQLRWSLLGLSGLVLFCVIYLAWKRKVGASAAWSAQGANQAERPPWR